MPDFNTPLRYTYDGEPDRETRKFTLKRGDVLSAVFASDDWPSIVRTEQFDENFNRTILGPTPPSKLGVAESVEGQRVEITLAKDQNVRLVGALYTKAGGAQAGVNVIVLTGSGGPPEEQGRPIVAGYLSGGMRRHVRSVLLVAYRGFGASRHPSQQVVDDNYVPHRDYMPGSKAFYTDAAAMLAFVQATGAHSSTIVLHGYSLGSGPAVEIAKRSKGLGALVLHGAIKSVYDEAKKASGLGALAGGVAHGNVGFENDDKIGSVACPILVTSGPRDDKWLACQSLYRKAVRARSGLGAKDVVLAQHEGEHLDAGAPFREPCATSFERFIAGVALQTKLRVRA